jgi:ABC-2 type transport system permease protein
MRSREWPGLPGAVRDRRLPSWPLARAFVGAMLMQARTTLASIENLTWMVTEPLLGVVAVAVVVHAGRIDLASNALSASFLLTLGQMGFWVGTDVMETERHRETLELSIVSPTPFVVVLFARILFVASFGLLGLAEGWLIVRVLFGVPVVVHHPWVLASTLVATLLAATGTSVLMSGLFSMARHTRTLQNAVNGPLYLLGGVLVPVRFLPSWLRPLSPFDFFSWSSELVRDAFRPESPADVGRRLGAIVALGVIAGGLAVWLTDRILGRLRREGTLGLS